MSARVRTWFRRKVNHVTLGDATPAQPLLGPRQETTVNYIQHVENANIGINYGHQSMYSSSNASDLHNLDCLPQHPDVSGGRSEYLENSRDEEMSFVHAWLSTSPEMVLCIHAAAGLGKSTFAHHLGEDLRSKSRLAAALFMSFIPDSWGPETIIRLIARELGKIHRDAIPTIASAIQGFSGSSLNFQQLVDQYIIRPIQSLKLGYSLTVLVDAIDEWGSHLTFLKQLSYLEPYRHLIKFVILGRTQFRAIDLPKISIVSYPLPPVSKDVIIRFFNARFAEVEWGDGGKPKEHQVSLLADKSNGVLVWAFTVYSLVSDNFTDTSPRQIVEHTLQSRRTVGDSEALAELYHGALMRSFPRAKEREYVRKYLQAISVLEEPLPLADFASLIGMELRAVKHIRSGLCPLQTRVPNDAEETVYPASATFHSSVMEYLQSTSTPQEFSFGISLLDSHAMLAAACLNHLPKIFPRSGGTTAQWIGGVAEYVVWKWPIHATRGMPCVEPDAGVNWKETRLCITLQSLPIESLRGWSERLRACLVSDSHHSFDVGALQEHEELLYDVGDVLDIRNPKTAFLKVACLELAVRLRPASALYWSDLGWAYHDRATLEFSLHRGEQAIRIHRHAVQLASTDPDADEAEIKHGLASCLGVNFNESREPQRLLDELEESILLHREILQLRPEGNPDRPVSLDALAYSIRHHSKATNALEDVNESIQLHRQALELQSEDSPNRPAFLRNFAYSLRERFEISNDIEDLNEAIRREREALNLLSEGHTDRANVLHGLACSAHTLFQATDNASQLEECIQWYREALNLLPENDPDRALVMHDLASALCDRFDARPGTFGCLEESIEIQQEALRVMFSHEGFSDRVTYLHFLADCIRKHGGIAGNMEIMEGTIKLCWEAISLRPETHPAHAPEMYRFAVFLRDHFDTTQAIKHLDGSIGLHRKVLELRPKGHLDRAKSLHDLSSCLRRRFKAKTATEDLEESIQWDREALELRPEGHPHRFDSLHNLAVSLRELLEITNDPSHLQEAFRLDRAALALRPEGRPERHISLRSLSWNHYLRFQFDDDIEDLRVAISLNEQSLALCPPEQSADREAILADSILFTKALSTVQSVLAVEREMKSVP